jgi:hypothetical protein
MLFQAELQMLRVQTEALWNWLEWLEHKHNVSRIYPTGDAR